MNKLLAALLCCTLMTASSRMNVRSHCWGKRWHSAYKSNESEDGISLPFFLQNIIILYSPEYVNYRVLSTASDWTLLMYDLIITERLLELRLYRSLPTSREVHTKSINH